MGTVYRLGLLAAVEHLADVPWGALPIPTELYGDYVVDVKVHDLKPGQLTCIGHWHRDFVPRDPETLVERPSDPSLKMYLWMSGPPYTEFRDGRKVKADKWVEFTQLDEHRGTPATKAGSRTFVRVVPTVVAQAGVMRERSR